MSPLIPIAAVAAFLLLSRSKAPAKKLPPPPPPDGQGQGGSGPLPGDNTGKGPGKIKPQGGNFPMPHGSTTGVISGQSQLPPAQIIPALFQWPGSESDPSQGDPNVQPDPIEWLKTLPATNEEHEVMLATGIPQGHWLVVLRMSLHTQTAPSYGQLETLTYHLNLDPGKRTLELVAMKAQADTAPINAIMLGCSNMQSCGDPRDGYTSIFEPGLRWANGGLELSFRTRALALPGATSLRAHANLQLTRGVG